MTEEKPSRDEIFRFLEDYPEAMPFLETIITQRRVIKDLTRQIDLLQLRLTEVRENNATLARDLRDTEAELNRSRTLQTAAAMFLNGETRPKSAVEPRAGAGTEVPVHVFGEHEEDPLKGLVKVALREGLAGRKVA